MPNAVLAVNMVYGTYLGTGRSRSAPALRKIPIDTVLTTTEVHATGAVGLYEYGYG